MHFGQNAKKVTINGGEFKEIGGNHTVVNQRSPETDSRNTRKKKVVDPYTDKTKRFDGQTPWQTPRASESYHPPDNHGKYYASIGSDNQGDYTQPLPHSHSHFIPRQGSFAGGHVADPNSLNMKKAQNDGTFYNDPWAYQYVDRMPPPNHRHRDRPQEREMHEENTIQDIEEHEDRQSTGGSFGNDQITAPVQRPSQSKSRPHIGTGVHHGPSTTVNGRPVQRVNDKTFRKQTQSFSDQYDIPKVPENMPDENSEFDDANFSSSPISGDESHPQIPTPPNITRANYGPQKPIKSQINHPMRHSISSPPNLNPQNNSYHIYSNPTNNYKSDDADYSSSHGVEAQDSMTNRMAKMSIRDPVPLPRSRNEPHSQILAPYMARGMSAPAQIQNTPLAYHPMGYSNPPNSSSYKNPDHNSYSNPMNNYKSDYPPSPDIEAQHFTCARPGPSIYDSMPQHRSRDEFHSHQSPTHPTPPPAVTWAGGKSYGPPPKPNAPQAYYPTGHSNPSKGSMSYNNSLPHPSYSDTS